MPRLVPGLSARAASRILPPAALAAILFGASLALPSTALAHGASLGPIEPATLLTGWSLEVHVLLPLVIALAGYHWAVRTVDRAHPASRVPRRRVLAWDAGILALVVALQSPIATYDTTLFSAHMVQHLLLTMFAAPLLALGAPITLLLRVVRPEVRRRWVLPVLHSRPVRVLAFPVVAWVLFAATMYVSHFSPLFDAALESEPVHILEHALYLGSALLFWWPAVGADPAPWRLPHPARVLYLFIGMPWSSFLGLAIFSSNTVLYAHYATLARGWGPTPLEDQQLAGGIMWAGGDALFLIALILAVRAWLGHEDAEGKRVDARLDREAVRAGRR
jgi:putative copper resistance protein D